MTLNFPDAPSVNDEYTDSTSGFTYKWNGTVWISTDPARAANIKELDDIAKAKADKCYEDWYNAQCEYDPSDRYDGYHLEDLSDMDREEPCI